MEDIALAHRSEMREIAYQKRIQAQEIKAKLLELLPGINLDFGKTYSSNTFLFNNNWIGYGNRITWNLLNVFRYPSTKRTLEAQADVLDARTLALSMAIMTQVHVAYARYEHARRELDTAADYRDTQSDILEQIRAAAATKSVSEQSLIREEMNNLLAEAKYDIAHADLESAFASLYAAMGSDAVQGQENYESTRALADAVQDGLSPISTELTRQQAMADFGIDEDWLENKNSVLLASLEAEIELPPEIDKDLKAGGRIEPTMPNLAPSDHVPAGIPPSPVMGITKGTPKTTKPGFNVKLPSAKPNAGAIPTAPPPDALISSGNPPRKSPQPPIPVNEPKKVSLPAKVADPGVSQTPPVTPSRATTSTAVASSSSAITPVVHAGPQISVAEDQGPILIDIISRYEDPDGNVLSIVNLNDQNSVGAVSLDNGKVRYDPRGAFEHLSDGQTVVDTFTYTVTDGAGGDASGLVTVNVKGVNDAPIANADSASFNEDSGALAINILANDTDPERHTLMVASVDSANTRGVVKLVNGSVFYQPGVAFANLTHGDQATDSFSYTVKDKLGRSANANVSIEIIGRNNMPTAEHDTATFNEDDSPRVINVLANDTDAENTKLSIRAVNSSNTIGLVTFDGTSVAYTPGNKFDFLKAGQQAKDEFQYTVSDGDGGMQVATVAITVIGGNDAPRAVKDVALYDEDDGANVLNLVANDSDPEQDPLTIDAIDTTGTSGKVTLNNGTVSYDPNGQFEALGAGDSAVDSFAYTVIDGNGGRSSTRVEITVNGANDAPRLK